jgi:hypothetical protein
VNRDCLDPYQIQPVVITGTDRTPRIVLPG